MINMINWRRRLIAVVLIGVLGIVVTGCRSQATNQAIVSTASAKIGQVSTAVTISGVLLPNQSLSICSKMAGQVLSVGADVNDRVSTGQLLVQIDTKELTAQLQQAQVAVQAVRDQASQAEIGISTAKSNLDIAQKTYDRIKMLFGSGAASQEQLDNAQNQLDQANNAYATANAQYQTLTGSGLAQANAAVNLLQVQIDNGTINSPINGIVSSRAIDPGDMAAANTSLMTVDDTSTLKLQGSISQDDVPLLAIGQKVPVTVDAMPGTSFEGEITQIGPVALATGQYFPVVISIKNPGTLLAGMTGTVTFNLTAHSGVIVPASAIQNEDGQNYVYVVKNGAVSRRQVTLGLSSATDVQIVSGVSTGELVASSNVNALQNGMTVSTTGGVATI